MTIEKMVSGRAVAAVAASLILCMPAAQGAAAKKKEAAAKAAPASPGVVKPVAAAAATEPDDPDVPRFLRGTVDKETFLRLRAENVAALRGFDDMAKLPYNPRLLALQRMESQKKLNVLANPSTWTEIGPHPIPNGQTTPSNPVTGRVTALEIDPTNTQILYLGTAFGGVWRSTNGGTNWTPIFDTAASLAIGALALAPSDHTILYVGTGEANGALDSMAGVGLYRIDAANTTATLNGPINPVRNYTAADGVTAVSAQIFFGRSISRILVHPTDPATVFVATASGQIGEGGDAAGGGTVPPLGIRGVYRSSNATSAPASVTFTKLAVTTANQFDTPNTGNRVVNDIAFPDPADPNQLLVWINGIAAANDGGIYRSVNALGATPTFSQVFTTTVTGSRAMFANYSQASAPLHVVYVATGESNAGTACAVAGQSGALRVSTDGGATWSAKLTGGGGFCGGQCFYNFGLDVRPGATAATSDDVVWIGGNTGPGVGNSCPSLMSKSTTGATTAFTESSAGLHADTHLIRVDPTNANVVYHGNDGGIFKSTDGGSTWASLNNAPLSATQFWSVSTHPSDPNYSLGGTQDNGTNMYSAAASWSRVDFGDGGYARIDQSAANTTTVTMYHTYFNQTNNLLGFGRVLTTACAADGNWAFKGIYGGSLDTVTVYCDGSKDSFNGIALTDTVNFYAPIEIGPGTPNTVYYGSDRLYRSADRGDTAAVVSQAPIVTNVPIRTIGISRQNDNFRIVGLNNGQVWGTNTGSSTLTNITGNLPTPLKQALRVAFDPNDATGKIAWVSVGGYWGNTTGHVFKTSDITAASVVWTAASGSGATSIPDVPVSSILIDPLNSSHVYAGTDIGVYYSSDGGATWNPLGGSLPRVPVFEMAFNGDPSTATRIIRVATHGRGMWDLIPPAPAVLMGLAAD